MEKIIRFRMWMIYSESLRHKGYAGDLFILFGIFDGWPFRRGCAVHAC